MSEAFDRTASADLVARAAAERRARNDAEAARLAAVLARATPVEGCGPRIPVAPARGPQVAFVPHVVMPDEKAADGYKVERTGWRGFAAVRAADIFDDLERRAASRKDKDGNPDRSPFTKGQVNAARRYRDLVERHDAAGMKCASLEVRNAAGPGGGGEFMDAYLDEGREIEWMRQQIGSGVAMEVRRARRSKRSGETARNIKDRDLVDDICLRGKSLREVLRRHGWTGSARNICIVIEALRKCLDRMSGPSGQRRHKSS